MKKFSLVHELVVRWTIIFGVRSGSAALGLSVAANPPSRRSGGGGGCGHGEVFVTLVDGIFVRLRNSDLNWPITASELILSLFLFKLSANFLIFWLSAKRPVGQFSDASNFSEIQMSLYAAEVYPNRHGRRYMLEHLYSCRATFHLRRRFIPMVYVQYLSSTDLQIQTEHVCYVTIKVDKFQLSSVLAMI